MKPVLITSGEPAGIGPDICLQLAESTLPFVVIGCRRVFEQRARQLNLSVKLIDYQQEPAIQKAAGQLLLWDLPCPNAVEPGKLNPANASYVLHMLTTAATACQQQTCSALVTAPVHKGVINQAGIPFTGHTEFFADFFSCKQVVMLLASDAMKVALVTTHLPLAKVPEAITKESIIRLIQQLHHALQRDFAITNPKIAVAGLNPHAGEGGYLGQEELQIITPALAALQQRGICSEGPFSADTLFNKHNLKTYDAFVAMYHDQGLPVIKYASFGHAVNITLGMPIVRTSVDHGTALHLAGHGEADAGSLKAAVTLAQTIAQNRMKYDD